MGFSGNLGTFLLSFSPVLHHRSDPVSARKLVYPCHLRADARHRLQISLRVHRAPGALGTFMARARLLEKGARQFGALRPLQLLVAFPHASTRNIQTVFHSRSRYLGETYASRIHCEPSDPVLQPRLRARLVELLGAHPWLAGAWITVLGSALTRQSAACAVFPMRRSVPMVDRHQSFWRARQTCDSFLVRLGIFAGHVVGLGLCPIAAEAVPVPLPTYATAPQFCRRGGRGPPARLANTECL